jgi:hypothetical protein
MVANGPFYNSNVSTFPKGLSKNWFEIYGNCLFSGVFVSAFMPYASPFIGIVINKFRKSTLQPGSFKMDEKYATMLTTLFVTFAYGFAIPLLFVAAGMVFFVQKLLDKILVTYWFKFVPVKSDRTVTISIWVLKYAPAVMISFTGRCLL